MNNEAEFLSEAEQLEVIKPIWPPISVAHAYQALKSFRKDVAEADCLISKNAQRIITSGAIVELGQGPTKKPQRFFLKRFHRSVISPQQLQPKHDAANLYAKQVVKHKKFPKLVYYLTRQTGASTVQCGEWIYELSTIASGEDRYEKYHSWKPPLSRDEAFSMGQALAILHQAAEQVSAPVDPGPGFYDNRYELVPDFILSGRSALDRFLAQRPVAEKWLSENATDLCGHLEAALPTKLSCTQAEIFRQLPKIWIHGDWHCSNLTFQGNQVDTIFDFGLATPAPAIVDLAIALERNSIEWVRITAGESQAFRLDIAESILAGYQTERKLSPLEQEILPAITASVHIEAALNLIGYHLIVGKADNAHWSYDTYFRFHSQWFKTPPGKAYLAGLSRQLSDG